MCKITALLCLLAALNVAAAEDGVTLTPVYFTDGGNLTLDVSPRATEKLTNILWRFQGNMLAEWVDRLVPLSYYRTFKNRTALDTNTGRLEIRNLSEADTGEYSVELNNKKQMERYDAQLVKEVPRPKVWVRPLSCSPGSGSCTLICEADTTDSGPVIYSWRQGDGEWEVSEKDISITEDRHGHMETFSCRIKGPFNQEESEAKVNPLFQATAPQDGVVGKAVGGFFGALILLGLVVLVLWKLKKWPFNNRVVLNTAPASTTKDDPASPPPPGNNADTSAEMEPLKPSP